MSSTTMFLAHTAAAACQQTEAVSSREFKVGEQRKCFNRKGCDTSVHETLACVKGDLQQFHPSVGLNICQFDDFTVLDGAH